MQSPRPNIMFFMADQFRWDCLGCMGNPVIRTPNLDALAERGVLFVNAFTPNPICVPARAVIMTGNYSHVCTDSKDNDGRIREGQPLLTDVLKSVGYRTYAMGKLHFVPYQPPGMPRLVHGFEHVDLHESGRILAQFDPEGKLRGLEDYYDYLYTVGWGGYTRAHGVGNNDVRPCPSPLPKEHYVDHWIADCTIRQLDRHLRDFPNRPFFMFMSSPKPHSPYDPPRPYDHLYDPRQIPHPFGSPKDAEERDPVLMEERYTRAMTTLSPQAIQVIRSYYYGSITFLDEQIGRVLTALRERNLLENTIILFTADHGDLLGDFGTFFKMNHLNGSVRIPLIIAGPSIARAVRSEALVGLQDILPTLATLAGARIGQPVHGIDLGGHLANGRGIIRKVFYSHTGNPPCQSAMVCDGRWKYIYCERGAVEELYDQLTDIREEHNLVHDPASSATLCRLRAELRRCAAELGDTALLAPEGLVASPLDREAIRKLPIQGMGWRWY
ncbi:MAG: sulfatase-like hydrolase/transferase [Kiritimatiellae bacterium]|nr:sulfatase-like hydrolase/transferase [Kiritimatiellia bacterium]